MDRDRLSFRRRQLLQGLSGLPLLGLLPGCSDSLAPRSQQGTLGGKDTVLIIGAGIAGLAAANALNNAGIANIVIEARDRIGGRLFTKDVGGIPIDLGASWIHDPTGNPMTAFAKAAGVAQTAADPTNDAATIRYYDAINPLAQQSDLAAAYGNYNSFAQSESQWLSMLSDQASYKDGVELFLDNQPALRAPDQRRRTEQFIHYLFEAFDAGRWDKSSLYYDVNSPINAYGGSQFGDFPTGGYTRLAKAMASNSDIRLNHKVSRVQVRDDGVTVFADNASGSVQFQGSTVIVTLPLGVLKAGSVAFDPPLPASKQSAIAKVGFGRFEKIALRFATPFWQAGTPSKTHLYYVTKNTEFPTEFGFFLDYQTFIGQPALVGVVTAAFAEEFVKRTSAQNLARVMEILREVYGADVSQPTDIALSSWGNDPYTMGCYSFLPVGATPADMDELGTPVGERLLFAGEASYKERYGYADGSLSSGLREAQRLIKSGTATVTPGPI